MQVDWGVAKSVWLVLEKQNDSAFFVKVQKVGFQKNRKKEDDDDANNNSLILSEHTKH